MLSQTIILTALARLSDELGRRGVLGELNVVGGTAMVLAFNARDSTKDVDAIFKPASDVREWLNDAAKGFLSPSGDFKPVETVDLPNLRVQAPTPEYMLAMKVLASRAGIGAERGDRQDIAFLLRLLGLTNADAVMKIVSRYYDPTRILPRSVYLVDEILEELNS